MSGVTVAVAVVEDSGGLGGIETDDMWNSITNDMIAFDDMTSSTMDDSMINDMIAIDAVTSTITTTTTTTTMDDNTNYERSLLSSLECLGLSIENKELECENTECCTWRWSVLTSTPMGSCSNNENDGCPIVFCGYYFDESDCENAEECCTWSSSLSMCSGSYGDCGSPFLDDISPTDDNKVNDFTTLPTYDEMTLTPTSDWRPSSNNDGDDDDDDDDDTRNNIILGSVIGGVCVIIILVVLPVLCYVQKWKQQKTNQKKNDQLLNTTATATEVPVAYATEASAEDMPAPVPVDPLVGSKAPKKYIKWKDDEGLTLNPKYKAWMTANGNPTQ